MNQLRFLSESELKRRAEQHTLAFFGAGYFAEKTMNLLSTPPVMMFDNNPKKHGTVFLGVNVAPVEELRGLLGDHPDLFVVVCVQKYSEVEAQLKQMKIFESDRMMITPMAYELAVIDEIRDHDSTLLLSNYDNDGGLYLYHIGSGDLRKLASGSIRGFTRVDDRLYYVSYNGLNCLDANTFEPIKKVSLADEYDFCGLIYDEAKDELLIGDTQSDRVLFLDEATLEVKESVSFSEKYSEFGKEYHHVNDLVVKGEYVLAGVFSVNGWWRHGMCDGGLMELHRPTGAVKRIPIQNCWFPHSLRLQDDRLYLLDSMNGLLLRDLRDCIFSADGFLRGLEFNGPYCYIGQSLHRHVSRLADRRQVSADCGIHLFNRETKLHRFVSLPELTNIYQIMVISE